MSERVIVHVGQMKSGTTFIQQTLSKNRSRLLEQGVLYPGPKINQQHACYGLCGSDIYWVRDQKRWASVGTMLVDAVRGHDGAAVISAEALSSMSADGIQRFAEAIGRIDAVIVTVRNMLSTLLSAWQQGVKRGSEMSLDEFFARMHADRPLQDGLWRNYAFGNTVRAWSRVAPTAVLVVESLDRDRLVEAFLDAGGLGGIDLEPPTLSARDRNLSLRWEDVEVLRALNRATNRHDREDAEAFRGFVLEQLLFPATEAERGSRILYPRQHVEAGATWAAEEVAKFPTTVKVVGDAEVLTSTSAVETTTVEGFTVDVTARIEELLHFWFEQSNRPR